MGAGRTLALGNCNSLPSGSTSRPPQWSKCLRGTPLRQAGPLYQCCHELLFLASCFSHRQATCRSISKAAVR